MFPKTGDIYVKRTVSVRKCPQRKRKSVMRKTAKRYRARGLKRRVSLGVSHGRATRGGQAAAQRACRSVRNGRYLLREQ